MTVSQTIFIAKSLGKIKYLLNFKSFYLKKIDFLDLYTIWLSQSIYIDSSAFEKLCKCSMRFVNDAFGKGVSVDIIIYFYLLHRLFMFFSFLGKFTN